MSDELMIATMPAPPLWSRLRYLRHRLTASWRRFCDWLKWIGHKPSNLETYARRELEIAGWFKDDGFYGSMMGHAVLKMVREFSQDGHSGMSAPMAIGIFKKVASFEPLTPLTGAEDEWVDHGYCKQNKRCSRVFINPDRFNGQAYDGEAIIWRDPDGSCFTNSDSQQPITFPYTPTREYRARP